MAYVPPVHDARGEVNEVVGAHGEEVCGHELPDGAVAVRPVRRLFHFDDRPAMNGFARLLPLSDRGGQRAVSHVARTLIAERGERFQRPLRARLSGAYTLFERAEVEVNVARVHACGFQSRAREREELFEDEARGAQA